MSKDGRHLAIGLSEAAMRIWDLRANRYLDKVEINPDKGVQVLCLQFSLDGSVVSAGCDNGDIVVFNMRMNKRTAVLRNPETAKLKRDENVHRQSKINSLCFNYFKKHVIASCTENGSVYVWDSVTMSMKCSFVALHAAPASDIAFSPVNKSLLASVGYDKAIHFLDTEKGTIVRKLVTDFPLCSVSCSHTGDRLLVGTVEGLVLLYSLRNICKDSKAPPSDIISCHSNNPVVHLEFFIPPKKTSSQEKSKSTVSVQKDPAMKTEKKEAETSDPNKVESIGDPEVGRRSAVASKVLQESKLNSSVTLFSPPADPESRENAKSREIYASERRTLHVEQHTSETKTAAEFDTIPQRSAVLIPDTPEIPYSEGGNLTSVLEREAAAKVNDKSSGTKSHGAGPGIEVLVKDIICEELVKLENRFEQRLEQNKEGVCHELSDKVEKLGKDINFNTNQLLHDSTQSLQLEMMRQFKLQLEDITQIVSDLKIDMEKLKKENEDLKSEREIMRGYS